MHTQVPERLILVIDHNPAHTQAVQRVLSQKGESYRLEILTDGGVAMERLLQRGEYDQADRPDLVLLDLDLPDSYGHDILVTIKTTPELKRIPVIIFTQCDREEEIFRSYANQGNCYVIKAVDLDQLAQTVQRIEDFWLEIVTLPLK
ncbi:MAG TPA: response regulator [Leptolyngbyaceae cyanobacterium M65_K2018_010]|nr:response regulator [Leptolyngbyaceae cyanobacterium M65_K2018_010]